MSQEGTQAIRRAAAMLRCIARADAAEGATLPRIAAELDLPRSTAHRILKCLTEEGLAAYDPASRRYQIGPLGHELGLAVSDQVLDLVPGIAAADRVARRSNVTTYLMRRSGIEAVCLHKAEGRGMIRAIPVEVGQRRFLGVGAGATALLAGLDDAEVARILPAIAPELTRYHNLTTEAIARAVAEARATGFAESRGRAYASIYGLARAVPAAQGAPVLALSIAVHMSEVNEDRIAVWKAILREEVEAMVASAPSDRAAPRPARTGIGESTDRTAARRGSGSPIGDVG
jgi:DNA-binding IclR family transcriptional regulator